MAADDVIAGVSLGFELAVNGPGDVGPGVNPANMRLYRESGRLGLVVESESGSQSDIFLWVPGNTDDEEIVQFVVDTSGNFKIRSLNNALTVKNTLFDADLTDGRVGIGAAPVASTLLALTSTTGALLVPRMTTAQRDLLTAANGMIIYNTTTTTMQGYVAGAWADL